MAPFFGKTSDPAAKKQRELEAKLKAARADRERDADRLRTSEARVTERRDAARAMARGGGDDAKLDAVEAEKRAAEDRIATLTGALADHDKDIAELEGQIADIVDARCRTETVAAVTELADNGETVGAAAVKAMQALEEFSRAVAPLFLDGHGLAAFAKGVYTELPAAVASLVEQLKHHARQVAAGTAPASLPAPEPEPAPVAIVAPLQTRDVFCLRTIRWTDSRGESHICMQYRDARLEPHIAARAIKRGVCTELADPRRAACKDAHGGAHPRADAIDTVDLDIEQPPEHLAPIMRDDPQAPGARSVRDPVSGVEFTEYDRGPERLLRVVP